jgi:hypothetical protein
MTSVTKRNDGKMIVESHRLVSLTGEDVELCLEALEDAKAGTLSPRQRGRINDLIEKLEAE